MPLVAHLSGIGKTRVVKVSELGNSSAALADVVQESTAFIAACYGIQYGFEEAATMLDVRFKMWKVKTAKANIVSAPRLMSLLPNLKYADEVNPPDIDPTMHGWKSDAIKKM